MSGIAKTQSSILTASAHPNDLNVLVIGSGGREHALLQACLRSPMVKRAIAAPGNGGMALEATCLPLEVTDVAATVALARREAIDLAIVGPEVPLAVGVADALRAAGIATFGPDQRGAELEASKAVCKRFFQTHGIPTADWQRFTSVQPALDWMRTRSFPLVVKASGLAAGKGVLICDDFPAAENAVRAMLEHHQFGSSGEEIVIEEFLQGEEASLMVVISGNDYVCLPVSQDHKRIGEGDTGLNTGGMGAYAPAAVADAGVMQRVRSSIIEPTLRGFATEGINYRGVLFIGLMIHAGQPKVLEFNVRFGDPECQVLLPLFASDPIAMLWDCAIGQLDPARIRFHDACSLIVVLAANGYPGNYPKGSPITLPQPLPENCQILHAGTALSTDGNLLSAGGRVLGVVATAPSLEQAAHIAYSVCDQIIWSDKYYRRDIAHRQLKPQTTTSSASQ